MATVTIIVKRRDGEIRIRRLVSVTGRGGLSHMHQGAPIHPVQHLRSPFRLGYGRSGVTLASRGRTTERAGDGLLPAHRYLSDA